ncbi:MAG: hypothetical protein K2X08_02655 [Chlamydiales bacterium]|nr:hypothetical protein [Chlamydiales bacterium]
MSALNVLNNACSQAIPPEDKRDTQSPPLIEQTILITSHEEIANALQNTIDPSALSTRIIVDKTLPWPRDSHVFLPSQAHLIPAPFADESPESRQMFLALLPETLLHFYDLSLSYMGRGCSKESREGAEKISQKYHVPYKKGKTCIEGGNCLIFKGKDQLPKALVGYTSLLLSLISLYNQKYFEDKSKEMGLFMKNYQQKPSEDLFRVAKNFYFLMRNEEFTPDLPANDYTKSILSSHNIPQIVESMIFLTKQKIAEELQINPERIAYILQNNFHIDMEVFPGPDDTIFMHSERKMLKVQEKIGIMKMPFLTRTMEYSRRYEAYAEQLFKLNTKIIEAIGCKTVPVPGFLQADYSAGSILSYSYISSLWQDQCTPFEEDEDLEVVTTHTSVPIINFMNGLFFDGPSPHFITAGFPDNDYPTAKPFIKAFCKKVHKACPSLQISFINALTPDFLAGSYGSIHCLCSSIQEASED